MDEDKQKPVVPDNKGSEPNPLIPKSAINSVNNVSDKLTNAASGVDGVVDDLDKKMAQGLDNVEKKLDNWINGLDKFLGKF